jgi:hypothetical protein
MHIGLKFILQQFIMYSLLIQFILLNMQCVRHNLLVGGARAGPLPIMCALLYEEHVRLPDCASNCELGVMIMEQNSE